MSLVCMRFLADAAVLEESLSPLSQVAAIRVRYGEPQRRYGEGYE